MTLNNDEETIELWNDEQRGREDPRPPKYTWNLEFKTGTRELIKPIIHPCLGDWRIRYKINGKVVKDDKVKYFGPEIEFSGFLIIKEIK